MKTYRNITICRTCASFDDGRRGGRSPADDRETVRCAATDWWVDLSLWNKTSAPPTCPLEEKLAVTSRLREL